MSEPILHVQNISKRFGAIQASADVSLTLMPGEIHALIGPNGAGKSTLIAQIAGGLMPDSGRVLFLGQDVTALDTVARARLGLGRSFQVSAVVPGFSVRDNILLALQGREARAFRLFGAARRGALLDQTEEYAARTGLDARLDIHAEDLSHGERRRLELSMALALKPRAFLLDEPMAGLGNEGAEELTTLLSALKHEAPILLVEHDMDAVFALADRISVLVYGQIIATGMVDEIRANPDVQCAYLGEDIPL